MVRQLIFKVKYWYHHKKAVYNRKKLDEEWAKYMSKEPSAFKGIKQTLLEQNKANLQSSELTTAILKEWYDKVMNDNRK